MKPIKLESVEAYAEVETVFMGVVLKNPVGGQLINYELPDQTLCIRVGCNRDLPCPLGQLVFCLAYDACTKIDQFSRLQRDQRCGKHLYYQHIIAAGSDE